MVRRLQWRWPRTHATRQCWRCWCWCCGRARTPCAAAELTCAARQVRTYMRGAAGPRNPSPLLLPRPRPLVWSHVQARFRMLPPLCITAHRCAAPTPWPIPATATPGSAAAAAADSAAADAVLLLPAPISSQTARALPRAVHSPELLPSAAGLLPFLLVQVVCELHGHGLLHLLLLLRLLFL